MERSGGALTDAWARREGLLPGGDNLLDKLSGEDRARLFALGRSRAIAAGEEVVRQGTLGDCLFVVEEGELAVVRALPGDEERVLMSARPGMLLGELAVLDGGARAASLRAVRRSVLRVIPLGAFEAVTLHGGEAGHRILRAVAGLVHERLNATRAIAAAQLSLARPSLAGGAALAWKTAPRDTIDVLGVLPAFEAMDRGDRESMLGGLAVASVARGVDLVLPESPSPGVAVVLRGALSPWLDDERGPEVAMPAVGPGGFVDHAAALGFASEAHRWRVRSPTELLRLDPALFEPACPCSARLLYALSRDLAATLRRATGLAMHFEMAWAREARPSRKARTGTLRAERLPANE